MFSLQLQVRRSKAYCGVVEGVVLFASTLQLYARTEVYLYTVHSTLLAAINYYYVSSISRNVGGGLFIFHLIVLPPSGTAAGGKPTAAVAPTRPNLSQL